MNITKVAIHQYQVANISFNEDVGPYGPNAIHIVVTLDLCKQLALIHHLRDIHKNRIVFTLKYYQEDDYIDSVIVPSPLQIDSFYLTMSCGRCEAIFNIISTESSTSYQGMMITAK